MRLAASEEAVVPELTHTPAAWAEAAFGFCAGAVAWGIFGVRLQLALVGVFVTVPALASKGALTALGGLLFSLVYYGVLWGFAGLRLLRVKVRLTDALLVVGRSFVRPGLAAVAWAIAFLLLYYSRLVRGSGIIAQNYGWAFLVAGVGIWIWAMARATGRLRNVGSLSVRRTAALVGYLFLPGVIAFATWWLV
jgi:hypothetical protein